MHRLLLRRGTFLVTFVGLTLLGVGVVSRYALLTVILEGIAAATIVVPAALGGLWLVPLLVRGASLKPHAGLMPLRWHLLLGAALGLGTLSLLVLLLGLIGLLQRPIWVAILFVCTVAGVARLRMLLRAVSASDRRREHATPPCTNDKWACMWLLACPFLVLVLLAASTAPGLIWQEEGLGYDVLEYHLQLPKEYVQAGRIEYAPHNVYSSFPANVEMLYLLAMIVLDDVYDAGVTANMIHLIFAVLAVFAAWVAGREWSPAAGVVCGVVMATAGWMVYLCGLAYVENGMLFFGMAATAILLGKSVTTFGAETGGAYFPPPPLSLPAGGDSWRSITSAGVMAGFACGCKYTALPLIAAPLAIATVLRSGCSVRRRIVEGLVFTAATLVTFAPWLIKNQMMTGNPVFPLANSVFKASPPGWGEEETERWDRSHGAPTLEWALPALRSVGVRIGVVWDNLLWDKYHRFGPAIFVIALCGLLRRRRDRIDAILLTVLFVQLIVWLLVTHLFARFAVVMLIPLALLCGRSEPQASACAKTHRELKLAARPARLRRGRIIVLLLVAGCVWNFVFAVRLCRQELPGDAPASIIYDGRIDGLEYFHVVNHELPQDAKILLVGDAKAFYFQRDVDYCVTFNRNPFFEAVLAADTVQDLLNWLHESGYTHVLVDWSEVRRLASTYGFSPAIDPARLAAMFDALADAGMSRIHTFPDRRTGGRHVELYAVPQ